MLDSDSADRCHADAVGKVKRPRVRVFLYGLPPACTKRCLVRLKVPPCTAVECEECGAYGMLEDMGRARATPSTRGKPW